jgi:hypothetical protein
MGRFSSNGRKAGEMMHRDARAWLCRALGLIGVSAVALTGNAIASPVTSGSGTKAQCAPRILNPPRVVHSEMTDPGKIHQFTYLAFQFAAVTGCDNWHRLGKAKPQLERDGRWIDSEGPAWLPLGAGSARSNEARPASLGLAPTTHVFERRVNGHWEPARVQIQTLMQDARSGKIVAKSPIRYVRIRIIRGHK